MLMQIVNKGDVTVSVPTDDGTALVVEPGGTANLRPGNAEFAVRTIPGVEWGTAPNPHGLAEAGTEAGVKPIGEYVEANPGDIRYAVVGDHPATPGDVTVVGSDTLAVAGGITTATSGTAPAVDPDKAAPAVTPEPTPVRVVNSTGSKAAKDS